MVVECGVYVVPSKNTELYITKLATMPVIVASILINRINCKV